MAYNNSFGEKYEATKNLSRVEIAKLIRADIKAAQLLPASDPRSLPRGMKVSVRSPDRSINVVIVEFPGRVLNPAAVLMHEVLPSVFQEIPRHSKEAARCLGVIEAIKEAYNYDRSDIQTDYFDVRFYGSEGFAWELEKAEHIELLAEHEASGLLPDIRVTIGAGQHAEAQRQCLAQSTGYASHHDQRTIVANLIYARDESFERRTALALEIVALRAENERLKSLRVVQDAA